MKVKLNLALNKLRCHFLKERMPQGKWKVQCENLFEGVWPSAKSVVLPRGQDPTLETDSSILI